ncbi:hypothetical protein RMCBS344292_14653 [Rhizopus microsporus]|nr:hypothetical protein RMCBS344292_14653 [Rhizopus microsporus]
MTSYETRSSQNTRNKSSSSEQNDLKKLKSKYSAKLPTLKVLFSDWSDDDLLFVLEEANGDLDLAIDRISEGHANQWGEVKTKKSKKEAQKAKAATTASISPHQQSSTMTSYSPKPSTPSRSSNNDRPNRAGKASAPPNRARKINTSSNASSSWDKHHDSSAPAAGSWASIASSKQQNENVDESWNTTNATDNWASTSTQDNSANNNNDTSNEDQPKTWASLLKSKPKPEPETPHVDTEQDTQTTTITDGWNTTSTNVNDSWNTTGAAANDGWNATSNTTNDGWNTATTTTEHPVVDEWSTPVDTNESTTKDTSKELESSHKEPEVNKEEDKSTLNRLHNQEEPVVLPKTSDIASLDVKFGSLNVDDDQPEILKKETNSTAATTNEPAAESKPTTASAVASNTIPSTTSGTAANAATAHDANFAQSSYLKQQEATITTSATSAPMNTTTSAAAATAPAYQQQQQQQQQQVPQQQQLPQQLPHQAVPQQQQQQQPFGMDHLTSAYSSYLPSQPPTGVSGFGMNPMGSLPDYGIYGTEAQRAAAAMFTTQYTIKKNLHLVGSPNRKLEKKDRAVVPSVSVRLPLRKASSGSDPIVPTGCTDERRPL